MLDIELFRNNIEMIIDSEKKRFKNPKNAELVLEFDIKWRNKKTELQKLQQQRNRLSSEIGKLKKEGKTSEANKVKLEVKHKEIHE